MEADDQFQTHSIVDALSFLQTSLSTIYDLSVHIDELNTYIQCNPAKTSQVAILISITNDI